MYFNYRFLCIALKNVFITFWFSIIYQTKITHIVIYQKKKNKKAFSLFLFGVISLKKTLGDQEGAMPPLPIISKRGSAPLPPVYAPAAGQKLFLSV